MSSTGGKGSFGYTDNLSKAKVGMSLEHHMVHDGRHYYLSGFETLANTITTKWTLEVADNAEWPNMVWTVIGSDGIQFEFYEGTTSISGGSSVTPQKSNRNASRVSGLTVTKDPTSTNGTLIDSGSAGANNRIGILTREDEIILKQNTAYTFLVRSLGNGNIVSHRGSWYELD